MRRNDRAFSNCLTTKGDEAHPVMQEPPAVDLLVAELEQFARRVGRLLSEPGLKWRRHRTGDAWSLTEVVCHLRDVEREVHQARLESLIGQAEAFLPGAVADDWVQEREYKEQDGPEALASFLTARRETLRLLNGLDEEMWERRGQHAFFGPTSIHELVYLIVRHDQAHWEQITALLNE